MTSELKSRARVRMRRRARAVDLVDDLLRLQAALSPSEPRKAHPFNSKRHCARCGGYHVVT